MDPFVELRTDPHITSQDGDPFTPADAHELHEWPDEPPTPDEPVTWVVMDSGIHADAVSEHPWFADTEVVERYDATGDGTGGDELGHGTGVASIIAHNAPAVELIDLRIFGDEGRSSWSTIRDAYEWLLANADRYDGVNMSWGASNDVRPIDQKHQQLLQQSVKDVTAAGNTGEEGGSPATTEGAFSAGAVDENGEPTRFTSRDPDQGNPEVAAAGKDVKMARAPGTSMGSVIDEDFVSASGTSFAAPYTSSAYIIALHEKRSSWDRRFTKAAPDIPGTEADGEGLLKLSRALNGEDAPDPNPTVDASVWNFFGGDTIYLDADWLPSKETTAELVEETGDHMTLRFEK